MTTTTTTPTSGHVDLGSLTANTYVEGTYSIYNPQVGMTRGGKPFLKCLLRDASGEVAGRQWTFDESKFGELETAGFVRVGGHSQLYNGQVQFIIEQIAPVQVSREDMAALLPMTKRDIDEMFAEVKELLASVTHPAVKALLDAYVEDDELMERFRFAPAAIAVHHAWIGGLLEHTLQVMKIAATILPLYPHLSRDLVLAGLFLHDLGKTSELTWEQGFNYTTDGNLVGHVVRGAVWLQFKAAMAAKRSGHKLSADALHVLQHIVVSHHGLPEFGAAKVPSTPEAIFVSLVDNLDAKTQVALTAAKRGESDATARPGDFTDRIWALDTRIFKRDPLAGNPE